MATKKPAAKKAKKGKTLRKAKKLEAAKPLAFNAYLQVGDIKSE
jgi:hypothetical protein